MIFIFDTDISKQKLFYYSLTNIFGINKNCSHLLLKKLGLQKSYKTIDLNKDQLFQLIKLIDDLKIEINQDLKKTINFSKKTLINIKSYRGLRQLNGFPVRGQRTRSNGKTSKKLNSKF